MFWFRQLPIWSLPYLLIAIGLFLIAVCTVFFQVSERLQDRMAKKENNRRDWTFRQMRFLTLWLRRHKLWRYLFRAVGTAGGVYGVARGLWILLA
jgi:hypothetical protein